VSILLLFVFWGTACSPASDVPQIPVIKVTGDQPSGADGPDLPPEETEPFFKPTTEPTVGANGAITKTTQETPTGFTDPGRVTNLLNFGVWNQANEQIGNVEDLVLNLGTAHVDYVLVSTETVVVTLFSSQSAQPLCLICSISNA